MTNQAGERRREIIRREKERSLLCEKGGEREKREEGVGGGVGTERGGM